MTKKNANHCANCGSELKKSVKRAYSNYRCSICNYNVPSDTKSCKNHPNAGYLETKYPEQVMNFKCKNCGLAPIKKPKTAKQSLKAVDSLQRSIMFDRKFMQTLSNSSHGSQKVISSLINHIDNRKVMTEFKELWLPEDELSMILEQTECDKWVEKTRLKNVILWALSLFMSSKNASLPIKAISDASASPLGRKLTEGSPVSNNALGVRLEKPEFVAGLEKILQLCSAQLGSDVFNDGQNLVPVYYDWFYFVKSGNTWERCKEVGRGSENNGIKIGIGMDWESKAVVSLIMHGEDHPNDTKSFRNHLMIINRPGIVHITDKGPFDTNTMVEMINNKQHFIIPLKQNIKYNLVYQIHKGVREFTLRTPSEPKIKILEESMINLTANPKLRDLKVIKFQYNSPKTGKFESMELISSLPMSAEDIIEMSAWRWRSTETEFRTFQHEFGLEKLFLKLPEKTWPLLLIVLSCKMLLELTFRCIHMLHGGKVMDTATFKRGFGKFLNAIFDGEEPWSNIEPCNSPICPYRKKHGQRLR